MKVPDFDPGWAERVARERFGVDGTASGLPSYVDQNFRLTVADGPGFVLKIANSEEPRESIELQHRAMAEIARRDPELGVPRVHPALDGQALLRLDDHDGRSHWVHMLGWLPGKPMAELGRPTRATARQLGEFLGRLDHALAEFAPIGARRDLTWDLQTAARLRGHTRHVADPRRRALAERLFLQLDAIVTPIRDTLPRAVVHNDANDHNLLLSDDGTRIVGIIDFGDMVHTYRVAEVAIAAAYAMFDQPDPLAVASAIVEGYQPVHPLTVEEIDVLFTLIGARLATSVVLSAYRGAQEPDNDYLRVSQEPAWALIERLLDFPPREARKALRHAAGLPTETDIGPEPETILAARREHVGPSLSLAYRSPLTLVRGRGAYLYDRDGRAYLDLVNNVCHVGHCHPRVVDAARRQIAELNTNTRYLHPKLGEYAERLSATLPSPLEVCFFVCSGSEANELALRLARTRTGGDDVVVVEGAYHGNSSALIDVSPYKFDGPGGSGAPAHVRKVSMPDRYRGAHGYDDPRAGEKYADDVRHAFAAIADAGRRSAAFICESLLGCGGQIVLPPGYLERAYDHARAAGAVTIADEVQVGFGRVGSHFWAFETQGVVPDIVTLGKPIGNGHPMGAVITTREIADSFVTGMEYFNTFGGNPVSMAIGLSVLDVIDEEGLQAHAGRVGSQLLDGLRELQTRHPCLGDVRGLGLFIGVELVEDRATKEPAQPLAKRVIEAMKSHGVLISTDGPHDNVLKIKPPLVVSDADVARTISLLDSSLANLTDC